MSLPLKKVLLACITFLGLVIVAEGLAYTTLWLLPGEIRRTSVIYAEQTNQIRALFDAEHPARLVWDELLGWRYRAGYRKGDDIVSPQGLRSHRIYAKSAPPGTFRIAAFGDSFVYGNEVGTALAWTSRMEQACRNVEVLNYGVGGYGVDQAYLRYVSEGSLYAPHMVMVGFVSDDLRRLVSVYRRFIDDREIPLFKPRFVLVGSGLKLLPNPLHRMSDYEQFLAQPKAVTSLGQYDYWYNPAIYDNPLYDLSAVVRLAVVLGSRLYNRYLDPNGLWSGNEFNPASEAFRLQIEIFRKFAEAVRQNGAMPLIVLFPERSAILSVRAGSRTSYAPLAMKLQEMGLPSLDLMEAFRSHTTGSVESFFAPEGHYSVRGNEIVATWLLQWLWQRWQDQKAGVECLTHGPSAQ